MEQQKKHMMKDVVVVGFAMFAIFFGAGNLIFPPYLGMLAGRQWFVGFLCFILADAGLVLQIPFLRISSIFSMYVCSVMFRLLLFCYYNRRIRL